VYCLAVMRFVCQSLLFTNSADLRIGSGGMSGFEMPGKLLLEIWVGINRENHVVPAGNFLVVKMAARRGVGIYGIFHFSQNSPRPGFILGFAHLNESEIREGIRILGEIF
jgi:DNA-binding transcriptional MocR family regulator